MPLPIPRQMLRIARALVLFATVSLGIVVLEAPAYACSCGLGEPRDALAQADAAFVGVVTRAGGMFGDTTYRFDVEADLKGNLAEAIELDGGGPCGLGLRSGNRVGLLLSASEGHWTASICSQIDPEVLLTAGRGYPEPDGVGPIRFLVGGGFGRVRILALDAQGRTLAYGAGDGDVFALDVCPGERRFAEGVSTTSGPLVVLRQTASLEILRSVSLDLEGGARVHDIECLDRAGERILAAHAQVRPSGVLLVDGARTRVILQRGGRAWFQDGRVFAVRDWRVTCVPAPGVPCDRDAIEVPAQTRDLLWSPDGSWIAGFRYGGGRTPEGPSQVVVVEAATGRAHTFDLQHWNDVGNLEWIDDDTLAYLGEGENGGGGHILQVPAMTSVRRTPPLYVSSPTVVDGRIVALGGGGLTWLDLPSLNRHSVPVVGDAWALELVAEDIHADPQPPPAPELATDVGADDVVQSDGTSPLPWFGAGALLIGVAVVLRSRRRGA